MPNHVSNEIIFRGVGADGMSSVRSVAINAEGKVDFELLLPTPLNSWRGGVGSQHKVFHHNDLDWCAENWGTKWNAYGEQEVEEQEGTLVLRFDTAWMPPYGWLCALLNTLHLAFEHNWLSEGESRGYSGKFSYSDSCNPFSGGYQWEEKECDEQMQKHLHLLRWGVEEFADEESEL